MGEENFNNEKEGINLMATLQQLRKRKAELQAGQRKHSGTLREQVERKKLKQEIRELEHPKTYKTARAFKKFATAGLKGAGRTTKALIREQMNIGAKEKQRQLAEQKKKAKATLRKQILKEVRIKTAKSKKRRKKKRR